MKKILFGIIITAFISNSVLKGQILNVDEVIQEQDNWCWAAVSACVLDYYCTPTAQCEIAEYTRNVASWHDFGNTDCCVNPYLGCDYWNYNWGYPGSIQDILVHFANITNNGVTSYLSVSSIQSNLAANRVFVIRWGWTTGGGHFLVGYGYSSNNVYYMNPWYGEGMSIGTYSWVCNGDDHTWTHTNVLSVSPSSTPPNQPGTITGNQNPCQGNTQTYSISAVTGATSYTWTLPPGWSGSSTSTSINATAGSNGGTISVTANNSCGSSSPRTSSVGVTSIPAQPGTIGGQTSVCPNTVNTYSISQVSGATYYTWTLPSGWSGNSTSESINATAGSNGGTISVTANNTCGSSSPGTIVVNVTPIPAQPGNISGAVSICQNSTNIYNISPVSGATIYTWTLPPGWSGSSTSTTINATAGTTGGTISVTADNFCGSSSPETLPVTVNSVPSQPSSIFGNATPVSGSSEIYSVDYVPDVTYNWIFPLGWVQTGGGSTNSITVTVGTESGYIEVTPSNLCGDGTSQLLYITPIIPPPHIITNFDLYDFGLISLGDTASIEILLTNDGGSSAQGTISPNDGIFWTETATFNLESGQSTNITIKFLPDGYYPDYDGTINIDGTDPCNDLTVYVEGSVKLPVAVITLIYPEGTGMTTGQGNYFTYDNCCVNAIPNTGCTFDCWMTYGYIPTTITEDPEYCFDIPFDFFPVVITARFKINSYYLDLKAYLEGPFNSSGTMETGLNPDNLSLTQPFNSYPWNYYGNENVATIPNTDIVDWVLIELRQTNGDASTATTDKTIMKRAGFILDNGKIVDLDGFSNIKLASQITKNLYVVVWHRNHIPIMSASPLNLIDDTYTYDFSTGAEKIYGGIQGCKQLAEGIFGMIASDGNADREVTILDKSDVWAPQAGNKGYYSGDYNLDAEVDNKDKNNLLFYNIGSISQTPGNSGFICGEQFTDIRNGKSYNTVQIGNQCWMAENLNIGTDVSVQGYQHNDSVIEKYCYDCDEYGGLYSYGEAMDYKNIEGSQGICPNEWHVPTDEDWSILIDFLGGEIIAGSKMKETGNLHWNLPNNDATNESGFTGLGGGLRSEIGSIHYPGEIAMFWSSSLEPIFWEAFNRELTSSNGIVTTGTSSEFSGLSLRCIHGMPALNDPPTEPSNPNPPNGSIDQPLNIILTWECEDPENKPLRIGVYFDTINPPQEYYEVWDKNLFEPYSQIEGNTDYYWRVVAADHLRDTTYGPVWTFKTGICESTFIDERDGQSYSTIRIGNQCWMAENLNVGTPLNFVSQEDNGIIEKYCIDCDVYGGLYQYWEMMDYNYVEGSQGICPEGWYVPTDEDWYKLTIYLGGEESAGGQLKEASTAHWNAPNVDATNSTGFTALPGGYRGSTGSYSGLGSEANFWTSTEEGGPMNVHIWQRKLTSGEGAIFDDLRWYDNSLSVRCIKGVPSFNKPPLEPSWESPVNGSVNQPLEMTLSWLCFDPEDNSMSYAIYFDTVYPPQYFGWLYENSFTFNYPLEENTTYYWKIEVWDDRNDTTVGPIWTFKTAEWQCGNLLLDERDWQTYNTVQIGEQCWMAENLNIGTEINITEHPLNNGIIEKHCYDCDIYGGLYNWLELMNYNSVDGTQGICPEGWHIPTDEDFFILSSFLGGDSISGSKLKEAGNDHWNQPNSDATNESGFTALPGGTGYGGGGYGNLSGQGDFTLFYSSTLNMYGFQIFRSLFNNTATFNEDYDVESMNESSVRCIKDI